MKPRKECINGDKCPFLKKPGGCNFWHHPDKVKLARNLRKKIKKKERTQSAIAKSAIANLVTANLVTTQPVTNQVIIRPLWRSFHRGCDDCSHKGCSKCHYRTVCGQEIITAPCRLPREIACRTCGAIGDADNLYCLKCGY